MSEFFKGMMKEIRVELHDEFDKNFERKAFFDKPWIKRKREGRGSTLVVSGRLRRGLRSTSNANSVRFTHDAPYAKIHNEGGTITVTPKMRKFYWAMYYKNMQGVSFSIKTRGTTTKKNARKNDEAGFWRAMALNRKGKITIPQRQYIGDHPRVGRAIEKIATKRIEQEFNKLDKYFKR